MHGASAVYQTQYWGLWLVVYAMALKRHSYYNDYINHKTSYFYGLRLPLRGRGSDPYKLVIINVVLACPFGARLRPV